ncbi:MAG: hypothetical protein AB1925_08765 [Actinomycetota bacterium]
MTASSAGLRPWPALELRTSPEGSAIGVIRPATDQPTVWADAVAPAPFADAVDDAFIDSTIAFRAVVTPLLNRLGYVGKQIYIGVNFVESIAASLVFNGTDILRGEGVFRNLADVAADVGRSAFFVAIDEAATLLGPEAVAIDRAPLDRPTRWRDADPPFKGRPLSVPDRGQNEDRTEMDRSNEPDRPVSTWKARKAERAERAEQRAEKRTERKAARAERTDKPDKPEKAETSE